MKPKKIFLIVIVFFCVSCGSELVGAMENYCKDPESWKQWDAMIQKYPDDLDMHALHALRLRLCAKIERGDITVEDSITIFENAREAILEKKKSEAKKEEEDI
jgi:hypothetical protein